MDENTKKPFSWPLTIKVKKTHPDARLPVQARESDAGYDIFAVDDGEVVCDSMGLPLFVTYDTGIAVEPPEGYHIEIFPRSSISNTVLALANSIGCVDNGFRGRLTCRFRVLRPLGISGGPVPAHVGATYRKGDRIAQLQIRKTIHANWVETDELGASERGTGGYGSSGS